MWRREKRREEGEAGCKVAAGFDTGTKNLVRETSGSYINREGLTITPSFLVYKEHTHIKIQTFLSLTNNLTIIFLFL